MNKLWKGLRINVWRMGDAGGYSIARVDNLTEELIKVLSGGQPFDYAYQEAEELSVLVDAELVLSGEIIRKSIKGNYYEGKE